MNLSFVSSYSWRQLLSWGGACVHVSSRHWDPIWPRPVQALCMLHRLCEVMASGLGDLVSLVSPTLSGSYVFLPPLAQPHLSREGGSDGEILFRTECSKVSFSAHCPPLSLCMASHLLQEKAKGRNFLRGNDFLSTELYL